jgi:hypothetical protein
MGHLDHGVGYPDACCYCEGEEIHWSENDDGTELIVHCPTCERSYTYVFDDYADDDDDDDYDERQNSGMWTLGGGDAY